MIDIFNELQKGLKKEQILKDEPMKNHTSFRIGGVADFFVRINNLEQLKFVLKLTKRFEIPLTIIGNGTNLLVSDKGIRGIVLKPEFNYYKLEKSNNKAKIIMGSSFSVGKLSNVALKEGLSGAEFLAGIPGSIGGAIRMNAGAHGREMKDIIVSTKYIDIYDESIKEINLEEHKFEYRNSLFSKLNSIILETTIELEYGEKEEILKKLDEYRKTRIEKQPLDFPSAGSTFKRIENKITAKLIDECGLKGYRIGNAAISSKHAGFIINLGNATCKDVLELVEYTKEMVKEKFNENIELEIILLGEF